MATPEAGLNVIKNDALVPLPGTMDLREEAYPVVLRYDAQRLLIGTRTKGLFLYDGASLQPFHTEFDSLIVSSQLYRGTVLPNSTYAFSTTTSGLLIIDHMGRRVRHVTKANGLPSDTVYNVMRDREGALWVGLVNGVVRVETPSPLLYFNEGAVGGGIQNIKRINGRLYAGLQSAPPTWSPRRRMAVSRRASR